MTDEAEFHICLFISSTSALRLRERGSSVYYIFLLLQFYFGCNRKTAANLEDIAVQCFITFAGFKRDQQKAVASYTFTPTCTATVIANMMLAVLPNTFVNLTNVTIIQNVPVAQALPIGDVFVVIYA